MKKLGSNKGSRCPDLLPQTKGLKPRMRSRSWQAKETCEADLKESKRRWEGPAAIKDREDACFPVLTTVVKEMLRLDLVWTCNSLWLP